MSVSPKQRMLNAYKGFFSDRYPVAPEFWYYYPAKILGVSMVEYEREIPLWKGLLETFKKFDCEGWGCISANPLYNRLEVSSTFDKYETDRFIAKYKYKTQKGIFIREVVYSITEPSWCVKYPVEDPSTLGDFLATTLFDIEGYDFSAANNAYRSVDQSYLLEFALPAPFFDIIAWAMGFEKAMMYFWQEQETVLNCLMQKTIENLFKTIDLVCQNTDFESFFIGCSYSCNSLIGPKMWRQWDKPVIKAVANKLHQKSKLLHIHFHGKCIETLADFAEIGIDCVCPFERPPGGDVDGLEGLKLVRKSLNSKVTMNGNVHTVETLIRGTTKDVKREVNEIIEAFDGEPRLIIGSGDQIGYETPEENIRCMIETVKNHKIMK